MSQIYWKDLRIDFNLIAVQNGSPVDVLCPQYHCLLALSLAEHCYVHLLIELEQHGRVKTHLVVLTNEIEDEGLTVSEVHVYLSIHSLSLESLSEEAD